MLPEMVTLAPGNAEAGVKPAMIGALISSSSSPQENIVIERIAAKKIVDSFTET